MRKSADASRKAECVMCDLWTDGMAMLLTAGEHLAAGRRNFGQVYYLAGLDLLNGFWNDCPAGPGVGSQEMPQAGLGPAKLRQTADPEGPIVNP